MKKSNPQTIAAADPIATDGDVSTVIDHSQTASVPQHDVDRHPTAEFSDKSEHDITHSSGDSTVLAALAAEVGEAPAMDASAVPQHSAPTYLSPSPVHPAEVPAAAIAQPLPSAAALACATPQLSYSDAASVEQTDALKEHAVPQSSASVSLSAVSVDAANGAEGDIMQLVHSDATGTNCGAESYTVVDSAAALHAVSAQSSPPPTLAAATIAADAMVLGTPFLLPTAAWETNQVVLVGVVLPPRVRGSGKQRRTGGPLIRAHDGNVYRLLTVQVSAQSWDSPADSGVSIATRVDVLVPPQHPLLPTLDAAGATVALRGRIHAIVSRNRREEEQRLIVAGGVYVQRQEVIIVADMRCVDPHTPHDVVGHLCGSVDRVLRMDTPINPQLPHERYHVVRLTIQEAFPRRAPARGTTYVNTAVTLYVPTADPQAALLLRVGNQVRVEYAVTRVIRWLGDRALETVKPELRDRARTQMRDEFIVTAIEADRDALPLDAESQALLAQKVGERQRERLQRLRATRKNQRRTLAQTGLMADAGEA